MGIGLYEHTLDQLMSASVGSGKRKRRGEK